MRWTALFCTCLGVAVAVPSPFSAMALSAVGLGMAMAALVTTRPSPARDAGSEADRPQEAAFAAGDGAQWGLLAASAAAAAVDEAASAMEGATSALDVTLAADEQTLASLSAQVERLVREFSGTTALLTGSAEQTATLTDAVVSSASAVNALETCAASLRRHAGSLVPMADGVAEHPAGLDVAAELDLAAEAAVQVSAMLRGIAAVASDLGARLADAEQRIAAQETCIRAVARTAADMHAMHRAARLETLRLHREGARMQGELCRLRREADRLPGRTVAAWRVLDGGAEIAPSL